MLGAPDENGAGKLKVTRDGGIKKPVRRVLFANNSNKNTAETAQNAVNQTPAEGSETKATAVQSATSTSRPSTYLNRAAAQIAAVNPNQYLAEQIAKAFKERDNQRCMYITRRRYGGGDGIF